MSPAATPQGWRAGLRLGIRVCVSLLILVLAWEALAGGRDQLPRAGTVGQVAETWIQLACGVLSLAVVATCFLGSRWAGPVRGAWAASLALTAGLSALVWGPPMPGMAALFAVFALLMARAAHRACPASGDP